VNVMIADAREDAIPVAVDALGDETIERFGRVDLVCNNAGVVGSTEITAGSRCHPG
jgi:NAD(P)-dependent dehydrogenase (short-subunit alcohol dehydrogenase family)